MTIARQPVITVKNAATMRTNTKNATAQKIEPALTVTFEDYDQKPIEKNNQLLFEPTTIMLSIIGAMFLLIIVWLFYNSAAIKQIEETASSATTTTQDIEALKQEITNLTTTVSDLNEKQGSILEESKAHTDQKTKDLSRSIHAITNIAARTDKALANEKTAREKAVKAAIAASKKYADKNFASQKVITVTPVAPPANPSNDDNCIPDIAKNIFCTEANHH